MHHTSLRGARRLGTIPTRIFWVTPDRFDRKLDKSSWLEMARCLQDLGWEVTIVAARKDANAPDYGGLVKFVPAIDLSFVFRISALLSIRKLLKQELRAGDVVLLNQDALWLVPGLRRIDDIFIHFDVRTLPVNVHGLKRRLGRALFWSLPIRFFAERADGYSFITTRLCKEVESEFNLRFGENVIWGSGVNLSLFNKKPSSTGTSSSRFRLLYHGSISHTRGIGSVIEALSLGGRLPIEMEFRVVGDGIDRAELEEKARHLGMQDCIIFKGYMPYEAVVDEILDADVCICPLPDRLEWNVSSPLKVFEYMACGKPLILTPIDAHREVVGDAPFVVWTRGYAPQDFRRAIFDAFTRLDELRRHSEKGYDIVRDKFEWKTHAVKLASYLSTATGSRAPEPGALLDRLQ